MAKKVLITGGAGFIGSHLVRMVLARRDWEVVNVDALTYAGNLENVADVEGDPRYRFVQSDIADGAKMEEVFREGEFDYVMHLAAETHVDNSIADAAPFIKTNVFGTQVLLELARKYAVQKFLYVSTDEVYGDLPLTGGEKFKEDWALNPSSPYSASKASGDLLTLAYGRTYQLPVLISRCSNNYGTHQFAEKLIPFFVRKLAGGEKAPLYGDGKNVREWIWVEDHCSALLTILEKGELGEVYNVGSGEEKSNREIYEIMCEVLGMDKQTSYEFVEDRKGHDRRYAIDSTKLRELGWSPEARFEEEIKKTILFYKNKFKV